MLLLFATITFLHGECRLRSVTEQLATTYSNDWRI